jgi:hypothetical protein
MEIYFDTDFKKIGVRMCSGINYLNIVSSCVFSSVETSVSLTIKIIN